MGCKSTRETVEAKLVKKLFNAANRLLKTPEKAIENPTYEDMERVVSKVLREKFEDMYKYPYQAKGSHPPNRVDDYIQATEGMVNYDRIEGNAVDNYVDSNILGGLGLRWIKSAARADLIQMAKNILNKPVNDFWETQFFTQDYENQDKKDDDVAYRANSVFLYVHASLEENQQKVDFVIIAYIGVYFKVTSPTKAVRDRLLDIVLANAKKLPGAQLGSQSGPETAQIEHIVEGHARHVFKNRRGFEFGPNMIPPDKVLTAGIADVLRSASVLCLPARTELDHLTAYINANILNAMNLPSWLRDDGSKVHQDLEFQFRQLLSQETNNNWMTVTFDKTYESTDPTVNGYRTTAFFIYNHASLTYDNVQCDQLYLYYIGKNSKTFYQVTPPVLQTRQSVMVNFEARLAGVLENPPEPSLNLAPETRLRKSVEAYGVQEFKNWFEYDWRAKDPPGIAPGRSNRPQKTQAFFYFAGPRPSGIDYRQAVKNWIMGHVFSFCLGKPADKYNIETGITDVLKQTVETTTGQFQWDVNRYSDTFEIPNRPNLLAWNLNLILVASHGEMNLDATPVKDTVISVTGVLYPVVNDNNSNDGNEEKPGGINNGIGGGNTNGSNNSDKPNGINNGSGNGNNPNGTINGSGSGNDPNAKSRNNHDGLKTF